MQSDHDDQGLGKQVQVQTIAWEHPGHALISRFVGTLGNALRPVRGAPQLVGIRVGPAFRFALLSALPVMVGWGVVPFTATLLFKGNFDVEVISRALPVWLDVLRAMGLSFAASFVTQLAWALPFVSLLRAFAASPMPAPLVTATGWRFVLYRAWLVPGAGALLMFGMWALPQPPPAFVATVMVALLRLAPQVIMLLGAQAMSLTFGASMLGSLAVALVPMILQGVVWLFVTDYADYLLPHLAELTRGQQQ